MDQKNLNAQTRPDHGKGAARRLRAKGLVPAIVYGRNAEPVAVAVDPEGLKEAIATPKKFNTVISLKLGDGQGDKLVLLKDFQMHPVTRALLHADFQEVRLDQLVKIEVPIVLTGKAQGTTEGGILSQLKRTLAIQCLPKDIPEKIEVDVTPLKIAQSLHLADVKLPEGVKSVWRVNETIAVVNAPEAEEAAPTAAAPEAAAAAAAGAAGAAAPAAAGAAPAKGAAPAAGAAPAKGTGAAPAAKPAAKK